MPSVGAQMTYTKSIGFLYSLRLFGLKLGLENTRKLAALAGNPQDRLRFIHIAGTNGKGSVAAMLESIYRSAGLKVGLYTSPHLVSFRERIQINRQWISETEVVRLVAELQALITELEPSPTFFEFVTVMALRYFAEQQCDLVIWETGLGGRLDATNIVTPLVSIITNVEQDHQRWLGHDLKSIAAEKAGIIKARVPVVTAASEPEAQSVIEQTAKIQQSPLTRVTPADVSHPPLDRIRLPLPGKHQRINAATALAAVETLQSTFRVDEQAIVSGLTNVCWPGRLQLIDRGSTCGTDLRSVSGKGQVSMENTGHRPVPRGSKCILLDGAHNVSGVTMLRSVLAEDFADLRPALILGILDDKDWEVMCQVLAPVADRIVCVPVKSERGTDPEKLAEACREANGRAQVAAAASVQQALDIVKFESFVVIAGSLYLVGEALEQLKPGDFPSVSEQGLNDWTVTHSI